MDDGMKVITANWSLVAQIYQTKNPITCLTKTANAQYQNVKERSQHNNIISLETKRIIWERNQARSMLEKA